MAPSEIRVKWETDLIIKHLLDDEDGVKCRSGASDDCVECDGPAGSADDNFDPVLIADKLKSVADALNDDPRFKAVLTELKKAAAEEVVDMAFSQGVDALCQTQSAEVAPEMQIIRASVAFGRYINKSCPELKSQVQQAMTTFLTRRVGSWIVQQGKSGLTLNLANRASLTTYVFSNRDSSPDDDMEPLN